MATLTIEIGKLMAQVETLQKQLTEIKKEIGQTKNQVADVHNELLNFMTTVQTKTACQGLHDKLAAAYVPRAEIAPLKTVAGMVALTTITALGAAFFNLILK